MPNDSQIVALGVADERPHKPGDHPWWQDSAVLCWWDLAHSIGGYHRIGHQPGHPDGPRIELSNNIFSADRVLKRCASLALRDDDRLPNGFGSGDGTVAYEFGDHATWTFQQEELSGELHISDFHPAVDIYPKGGQLAERVTAGHLEAAGAVTGRLTFAGSPYDIDGLAIRDRGWGVRIWEEILAHRWVAASFGAEATVYAVSLLGTSGQMADFGCVIRGDTLTYATDVDIITYLERDGVTHRGGHVRMELADGEIVALEAEPLQQGAVSWMAGKAAINDTVCRITWGERVGICDFEISNNASAGGTEPVCAINGFLRDGLHEV